MAVPEVLLREGAMNHEVVVRKEPPHSGYVQHAIVKQMNQKKNLFSFWSYSSDDILNSSPQKLTGNILRHFKMILYGKKQKSYSWEKYVKDLKLRV